MGNRNCRLLFKLDEGIESDDDSVWGKKHVHKYIIFLYTILTSRSISRILYPIRKKYDFEEILAPWKQNPYAIITFPGYVGIAQSAKKLTVVLGEGINNFGFRLSRWFCGNGVTSVRKVLPTAVLKIEVNSIRYSFKIFLHSLDLFLFLILGN